MDNSCPRFNQQSASKTKIEIVKKMQMLKTNVKNFCIPFVFQCNDFCYQTFKSTIFETVMLLLCLAVIVNV